MLAESYTCRCGEKNLFNSYVYANWNLVMTHRCVVCWRFNRLLEGEVLPDEEETTEAPEHPSSLPRKPGVPSKKSPVKKKVRPKKGED